MSTPVKQIKLENEFASKIVISLVKSQLYIELEPKIFDNELKEHFNTIRTYKLYDYILLKSHLNPSIQIQYKIVDIEPENLKTKDFKVSSDNTTLVQTTNHIKDKWIWHKTFDKALENYTNSLNGIVKFYKYYHELNEESLPISLVYGPSGSGKTRLVEAFCALNSLHLFKVNGVNLSGDTPAAVEKRIEILFHNALSYGPCVVLIKTFHYIFKFRDLNQCNKRISSTFFKIIMRLKRQFLKLHENERFENWFYVICTCESKDNLDSNILTNFNSELELKSLSTTEREIIFQTEFSDNVEIIQDYENDLDYFIKKTTGLYYGEIQTLIDFIKYEKSLNPNETVQFNIDKALHKFNENRKFKQENRLNIESVNWNDIGGLNEIKNIIMDTILLPLNYPSLFTSTNDQLGISRSGILLYGPPGTGKTLLAKAICNQCELNFLSVKGPELLDMYVGQTELNVRNLFQKARKNAPCVLFFDELDSLAPIRGRAGDSGGVMDRVVSQLLTEIDGLDKHVNVGSNKEAKSNQIFLIGATNRPDLIDTSLLRPGRFDKLVYVPVAKSKQERLNILKALIRKLKVDSKFDIDNFIDKCPPNLTGADFYALTSRARQNALRRLINELETKNMNINDYNEDIVINQEDFTMSLDSFVPTLNDATLLDYEKYFSKYSNNK